MQNFEPADKRGRGFAFAKKLRRAGEDEERTLQALEKMVPRADEEWAFRSHEEDLRKILRLELESTDRGHHQRARALVDRFGRLGMIGLGGLLD